MSHRPGVVGGGAMMAGDVGAVTDHLYTSFVLLRQWSRSWKCISRRDLQSCFV